MDSTLIAELIQTTKAYYSTIEEFVTSNPLLSNLRCVAGHIMRECDIYNFNEENMGICGDSLINGYWEELIGKVEELLHITDYPDNYYIYIQHIILYTSDGE